MEAQKRVNEYLLSKQKEKPIHSWHPSALGSCLTGIYLARQGISKVVPYDERDLRVFETGNLFEKWFLDLAELGGAKVDRQVKVEWEEMKNSEMIALWFSVLSKE